MGSTLSFYTGSDASGNPIYIDASTQNPFPVNVIFGGGGGGGGAAGDSYVDVVTTYTCITPFTSASLGDVITLTQIIDATSSPVATKASVWRNQTIAGDLPSAPSFTNLSLQSTTALTNAQLRATPVPVVDSSLTQIHNDLIAPLPSGSNPLGSVNVSNVSDISGSGTISALNGFYAFPIAGVSSVYSTITGSWTGSIQYQGLAPDSATWVPLNVATGGPANTYTTSPLITNGSSRVMLPAGFKQIRAYSTAWLGGTAGVFFNASAGESNSEVIQLNAANLNVTVANIDNTVLYSGSLSNSGSLSALDTTGYQNLVIQVSGAWNGVLQLEGNTDNTSFFTPLYTVANDRTVSDQIYSNGLYVLKTLTRYTRLNVLQLQSGTVGISVIGRTVASLDPSDAMAQAFDSTTPLYVSEVGIKKDVNKQIILSDGPAPVVVQGAVNTVVLIDTLGYQSLQFTSTGIAGNVTTSNDGINFSALTGAPVVLGALVTAISANASYIFPVLARWIKITVTTAGIGTYYLRNTLFNPAYTTTPYIAGATGVNGGVAGIQSIGGNIAIGTARTANPAPVGGVDINNLTRANLLSVIGQPYVAGPGESITQFSVGTGAAAVTDGTNGKTIFVQPKESDVYMEISAISTSPTIELEGSYDNQLFFVIPMTRVDNTAASAQYPQTVATSTVVPVAGALYRGKTYGCPILRVHLVAGSASNTIGTIRVVPAVTEPGVTSSPFGLVLANTVESVGVANGQMFQQGVRTLTVPSRGSCKVQLIIDAMTWTGTMSAGIQVVVEGLNDSAATTWNALTLQPLAGGATVTTITGPATAYSIPYSGVWEADLGSGNYNQVRVRLANVGTGGTAPLVIGGLRIIPVVSNQGIGTSSKTTFTAAVSGIAATTTNNLIVIESGAAKRTTIRKIYFTPGTATAASLINLTVYRETSASSGGATQTPSGRQASDSFSGIVRITNPTLGTNAATNIVFPIPTAIAASVYSTPFVYDFTNGGTEPGLVLPIGTANGVAFQTAGASGGAGAGLLVEFTEE